MPEDVDRNAAARIPVTADAQPAGLHFVEQSTAYAAIVASAEKAGSTDSANVLALIAAYPQVMLVSVLVFALAIVGLYAWTRRRAAVPPVVGDGLAPAEATFR